jgi:hypothetical protein
MPAADLQKSSLLKPLPRFPFVPQEPIQWLLVTIYQYSHQIWHSLVRMNILQSTSAIIQHQQLFCGIITESSGRTLQINRHKKIKYGVDWKVWKYTRVTDCFNCLLTQIIICPCKKKVTLPRNSPWRHIGLWDVKDPTLSRQSAHRWR